MRKSLIGCVHQTAQVVCLNGPSVFKHRHLDHPTLPYSAPDSSTLLVVCLSVCQKSLVYAMFGQCVSVVALLCLL